MEPSGWGLPLSLKGWSSLAAEGWDQKAGASPIWPRPGPVSSRWGGGLKEGLIPEASSRVLALNSGWESSAPSPPPAQPTPPGRLPPPLSSGIPSPKSLWGCGRRRCEPRLGGVLTPLTARARGWQLPASWARARASRSWHSCWHARQTPTATCSHPPTSAGALRALPASRASQRPSPDGVPGAPSPILGSPRPALCDPGPHPAQVGELSRRGC